MSTLMVTLAAIGLVLAVVGSLLTVVAAFRESTGWGLAVFFIPGASLVFTLSHWEAARSGFFVSCFGNAVLVVPIMAVVINVRDRHRESADTRGDETRDRSVMESIDPEGDVVRVQSYNCTIDTRSGLPSGFSKWCCTQRGWRHVVCQRCTSQPTESCDSASVGTISTVVCPTRDAPRRRGR